MSFIVLLDVLVSWCLLALTLQCPITYSPSYSSKKCNFALTFTDVKCSTFIFNSCRYSTCIQNLVGNDPKSPCIKRNRTHISNWKDCIGTCCSNSKPAADNFTVGYLEQCSVDPGGSSDQKVTKVSSSFSVGVIQGIVFGTVFVLVLLCFCIIRKNICRLRDKYNSCIQYLKQKVGSRNRVEANASIAEQGRNLSNTTLQQFGGHVEAWQKEEENFNYQDVCSICLCENPNVMLSCNHFMHSPCIARWIKFKMECSLCRSRKIHTVREYCLSCRRAFLIKSIWEINKGKHCQTCRPRDNILYAS